MIDFRIVDVVFLIVAPISLMGLWLYRSNQELKLLRLRQKEEQFKAEKEAEQVRVGELIAAMTGLTALPKMIQSMEQIPLLIEGLKEMCKHTSLQVDALNKAVDILQQSLSPKESEDYSEFAEGIEGLNPKAQERAEIKELMRKGLDEDAAAERVREARIYRSFGR